MNQEKIGKLIAECRKDKKLTQAQLAEKLNMSDKSISKWETGKGMPDSSIMLELCNYLGINVNELLSGEHLEDEEYKEKANENIIKITKEYEKNKKIKNILLITSIIIVIFLLIIGIAKIIYENIEINLEYDNRLIGCEIVGNEIICSFKGSSLIYFDSTKIDTDTETLIFITGKMLLQNKIHSHFETWDSMAQLTDGNEVRFISKKTIDINEEYRDKVKVYYTNISFNQIKKANENSLQEIIEQSNLIAEK